jgi:2-succinyl-6-hydroxy-2,4-cyclohexadiene-1-carboxylate synthase
VPEVLVLLHGFAGTHRAWDGVIERLGTQRYRPLALDLPGHGRHPARAVGFAATVQGVLAQAPERFAVCGYSLGGRVALNVALAAPARVTRLVLVAAGAGIEDPQERRARREADERLALALEHEPYERWIADWNAQPLFAEDPPGVGALALADQRRNDPIALAGALRELGAGAMEPLWARLRELGMEVDLLVGARDERYLAIARRMLGLLGEGTLTVLDGGHRLALEDPGGVAAALNRLDPQPGS